METTLIRKACRFRLEPSAAQRGQMEWFAGARRWVWNWALAAWRTFYREHGVSIPAGELSARLTALKGEPATAWLAEMENACRALVRLPTGSVAC